MFRSDEMKDMTRVSGDVMNLGVHMHVLYSAVKFPLQSEVLVTIMDKIRAIFGEYFVQSSAESEKNEFVELHLLFEGKN